MNRPSLSEIVEALHKAGIPPQLSAEQSQFFIRVLQLVASGYRVSPEQSSEIASALHMPLDDANSFLKLVSEIDEIGNVVGILGLSQKRHSHRFQIDGHILSTWCAWDPLFVQVLLKQTAEIESFCPKTKSKTRLKLSPYGVEAMTQPIRYFPWCYRNRTRRVRNPPRKSGRSFATMYFSSVPPRWSQNGSKERTTIPSFFRSKRAFSLVVRCFGKFSSTPEGIGAQQLALYGPSARNPSSVPPTIAFEPLRRVFLSPFNI